MKQAAKFILPLLVLALGALGSWAVIESRPAAEKRPPEARPPLVRAATVRLEDRVLGVATQGVVRPRTETVLVAEVAGRINHVSPSLAAGGFFEKDEVLVKIDPAEYRLAVVMAKGQVARARLELAKMEAEAGVARREWESLGRGEASSLALKAPQLEDASAALSAAQAALERADLDLSRTEVRAPFAGRVRSEEVDLGQYVAKGGRLAEIYAVDYAEVRLPLPDGQLAYLDLPLAYRNGGKRGPFPKVILRAEFAGDTYEWQGRVVRTEGEIDPKTRMVYVVAQVENPYGRGGEAGRPPLASGMFVDAEIEGKTALGVAVLPRSALRGEDRVLVIAPGGRLIFRQVRVLKVEKDRVVVSGGLASGELVSLTQPETVVEGMPVKILNAPGGPGPDGGKPETAPAGGGRP